MKARKIGHIYESRQQLTSIDSIPFSSIPCSRDQTKFKVTHTHSFCFRFRFRLIYVKETRISVGSYNCDTLATLKLQNHPFSILKNIYIFVFFGKIFRIKSFSLSLLMWAFVYLGPPKLQAQPIVSFKDSHDAAYQLLWFFIFAFFPLLTNKLTFLPQKRRDLRSNQIGKISHFIKG